MSVITLTHYNKNQYRKYPLKQGSSLVATDGFTLSDRVFVGCNITSTYGKHRIYIKQLFFKNGEARITIASLLDDEVLGTFVGKLTENFTTLRLLPFTKYVAGVLTIGAVDEIIALDRTLLFDSASAELEESTIFCYTPPAVTSILDKKNNALRGNVNFGTLTNLIKVKGATGTALQALYPASVFNPADKSTFLGNCSTPMIKSINEVVPFTSDVGDTDNDGNIYIAGVKPILFYSLPGEDSQPSPGTIGVETINMSLDSLCTQKHKLLPPVDVSGFTLDSLQFKNMYYSKPALPAYPEGSANYLLPRPARLASNFNATTKPEYYYWPQFVKSEYYDYWATPNA